MKWSKTVLWLLGLGILPASWSGPSHEETRHLPLFSSFYQDDEASLERAGESTQEVEWNGRAWFITAPMSLTSPPREAAREGTPLELTPLNVFVAQLLARGASVATHDGAMQQPVRLRLVLVTHHPTALGPATFSLQVVIAVRFCAMAAHPPVSALYVGPWKGATIKDWWGAPRSSDRWTSGYRDAFSLAVADALDWAANEAVKGAP